MANMLTPRTNWGQWMAAKDQELGYQRALTQEQELELTKEQAASAQTQAFRQHMRSLPLERPDQNRVNKLLDQKEKSYFTRLKSDYGGSLAKFLAAEGAVWQQQEISDLEKSAEYQLGQKNLEAIMQAKKAIADGKQVIGQVINQNGKLAYRSAESDLMDYYAGKTPEFAFRGAYKDDPDAVVKHFGSQYGRSKFLREPVADAEIQNYLATTHDPQIAADIYFRQFSGGHRKIFYKSDPLEDQQEFIWKGQDQAMQRASFSSSERLKSQQMQTGSLRNQLLASKVSDAKRQAQIDNTPGGYLRSLMPSFMAENSSIEYKTDGDLKGNKVLPHSGYDLGRFGGEQRGAVRFNSLQVFDKGVDALAAMVGATRTKDGFAGGRIEEGITIKGGFNGINLAGSKHQIVGIDPKIYINGRDAENGGSPMGFVKVKVRFNSSDDAKAAGLYRGMLGVSKIGAGNYDPDTKEATLYTPVGDLYKNRALNQYLSREAVGQKTTNDFYNPYTND